MGDFDKIIKENIETLLLTLAYKLLGIRISKTTDLPEKLQSTIEREPDFLKKVTDESGAEFILHLEFQTQDDAKMVYRMAEYKALAQRKFEMPVKQFVIYLGTAKPRMRTALSEDEMIVGFELRNIHDLPLNEVLESDVPEEIILSILTDYPAVDAENVINRILVRLKSVANTESELKRFLQQLVTLSRIRKLEVKTQEKIKAMPITYDILTDGLYLQGKHEGKKEGKEEGKKEGTEMHLRTIVEALLEDSSMSIDKIALVCKTTSEYVLNVQAKLKRDL